jgi:uncharacterized protein
MQVQDQIGYDEIIENSMRSVIYEALKKVEKTGLPGRHYFVITFFTQYPGAVVPKHLAERYPEEMTIVAQHQFRNLAVESDLFKISLSFNGKYEQLEIPYKAITSFNDPSINFALKFSMTYDDLQELELKEFSESNRANKNQPEDKVDTKVDLSAKVISLEAFRKNKGNSNK